MIKNIFLSFIFLFFCSVSLMAQMNGDDTIKIYQDVTGDYEYYSDLQYYYFNLSKENKTLLFKELNRSGLHKAIPVNLANLEFKISDSVKEQFLYFKRNIKGEISSCRLITNGSENLANKQHIGADTIPIADKIYSAEALRNDLMQIKNILLNSHPAIFQFTSKELFDKIYLERIDKIDKPMNLREFYQIACPLVESVHCGHTIITSRMTLLVPQKTLATAVKGISREYGIMPDYYVEPKIEDLRKGKDTAKELVLKLIGKSD